MDRNKTAFIWGFVETALGISNIWTPSQISSNDVYVSDDKDFDCG